MNICVIGFGANGLCSSIKLLKEGHKVTVFAEKRSPYTCSDTSAAIWAVLFLFFNPSLIY